MSTDCETGTEIETTEWDDATRAAIEKNIRLVWKIAHNFMRRKPRLDFDDLVQEGVFGLAKAHRKFDESLGFQFSTYASIWICQFMKLYIAKQTRTIHVPTNLQEHLKTASEEDIESDPRLIAARNAMMTTSISPRTRSDGEMFSGIQVEAKREPTVDFWEVEKLNEALTCVDARSRDVLYMRHGIDCDPHTLKEVGAKFGTSRERVRQIEMVAEAKVRARMSGVAEKIPTWGGVRRRKSSGKSRISEVAIRVARSFGVSSFSANDTEILDAISDAACKDAGPYYKSILVRLRTSPGRLTVDKVRSARSHNKVNRFTLPAEEREAS